MALTARLYACHIHLKQFIKSTKGDFREIEWDVTTSLQLQGLRGNYGVYLAFIPGGPEITEQSIQSIFQDFALINSYFLRLVG